MIARARRAVACHVLAALAVGCGGTNNGEPNRHRPSPLLASAGTSASATPSTPTNATSLAPRVFGSDASLALTPTHVLGIEGADGALFVRDFANDPERLVRVWDAAQRAYGPIVALADEHVVSAHAVDGGTTLLTTRGRKLCTSRLTAQGRTTPACVDTDAALVARLGDGFVFLKTDVPGLDDPEAKKKARREEAARKPAPSRPKKKKAKPTEVKVKADPKKIELYQKRADASLSAPSEWATTGLVWQSPLGGMDLVSAVGSPTRVRLLYWEYGGTSRETAPEIIGEARLALGSLDTDARYDPASSHKMKMGLLSFGFVDDHQNPRLVANERGILYFGQSGARGRCETAVVSPFVMPLVPSQEDCAVAPQRYFDFADAARARQKNKSAQVVADVDGAVRAKAPASTRAYGQASWDLLRVAGFGKHQIGLASDGPWSYAASEAPTSIPPPFAGARDLVVSGAFAADGAAYVETTTADVSLSRALDETARKAQKRLPPSDGAFGERRAFSRIGGAWVPRRGRLGLRRATSPGGFEPDAIVVGGREVGMRIALREDAFHVERVSPGGDVTPLAVFGSPITSGFDAAERPDGGALVVGTDETGLLRSFAIDASGKPGSIHSGEVVFRPHVDLRLTPFDGGGGVVLDEDARTYVWLSDEGRVLGRADAGGLVDPACGVPVPAAFPSTTPRLVTASSPILAGGCYAGDFGFDPRGVLLVLGEARDGAARRATIFRANVDPTAAPKASLAGGSGEAPAPSRVRASSRCPSEMVRVPGQPGFCIDRYESALAAGETGELLSPDGPPTPVARAGAIGDFATRREIQGDLFARAFPLPEMRDGLAPAKIVAVARRGGIPSGFVSGTAARAACEAAGKRLCTRDEWKTACRGEKNTLFPYGDTYRSDACNVDGDVHPAYVLHGHASLGHLDPRLDRVEVDGMPLLRRTGATPACASRFGDDAVFDMVGNLDEWIDDKGGAFAGGFYARRTQNGCEAIVDNHPMGYFDYSTGVRCCRQ